MATGAGFRENGTGGRIIMRLATSIAALLLVAGCAASGAPGGTNPTASGTPLQAIEALPAELGPLRRSGAAVDFEARPGGAGLGASARYLPANGERINVTVYIYDRGRARGPEGGESPDVVQEIRSAAAELNQATQTGIYRSAKFDTGLDMRTGRGPIEMRCANFRVVQRDGAATGDSVCVAVQGRRFVKLRLTMWNPPDPTVAGVMAVSVLSQVIAVRSGAPAAGDGLPPNLPRT
jgi:hypothetical protein